MVCHKAFEYLDADRLIHLGPAAGKLAKPHTDPAAGGGHGVFLRITPKEWVNLPSLT